MHENELQQIGLTEKEAKVYLSALTLGKATAQEVAKKADLKRPTTYFTIDLLMEKGLMSSVHEGKKQFFMAENPERLVDVYHKREDDLRRQGEKLKKMIPDLKKMRPKGEEGPVVKYYTGKEGALSMVKDLLDSVVGEQVWMMYPRDAVSKIFTTDELEKVRFVRHAKNVHVNAIYTSKHISGADTNQVTRKQIDETEMYVNADIAVYGNKIRLAAFTPKTVGVVIENKEMAETMKTLFKLAWEASDKHSADNKKGAV